LILCVLKSDLVWENTIKFQKEKRERERSQT